MKNSDVFTSSGYDMVVAVTQKSVNDQIKHLANPDIGVIKTRGKSFILSLPYDEKNKKFTPTFYDSDKQVPKNQDGTPKSTLLNGNYMPRISIRSSGTNIVLIMLFSSGDAWLRHPISGNLEQFDMKDWQYGISVSLDFAQIARSDINSGKCGPKMVIDKLTNFMSDGFSVAQLFVNFVSTDLTNFDPTTTNVNRAGDIAKLGFVFFMTQYLNFFKDHPDGNPYILGYTITSQGQTTDPDVDVPPILKPIGQTFTVFKDPKSPDLNTINFILNTKAGQKPNIGIGSHSTPGIFDTNWIDSSEQCDGKMIYSSYCCFDSLFLIPFYNAYSEKMKAEFSKAGVAMPEPPSYNRAKSSSSEGTHFDIANITRGDDQYVNYYTVRVFNSPSSVTIQFSGYFYCYKVAHTNEGICTAEAWAKGYAYWSANIIIAQSKDDHGKPTLSVSTSDPQISKSEHLSGENACATAAKTIAQIIGAIMDVLVAIITFGFEHDGFFTKLFAGLVNPQLRGILNPTAFLTNLSTNINTTVLLPAGHVFFLKNPHIDDQGDFSLELTYKTSTDMEAEASAAVATKASARSLADYNFIDSTHSVKIAIPEIGGNFTKLKTVQPSSPPEVQLDSRRALESSTPSPLAAPMFDEIRLASGDSRYVDGLNATVSCELMTNIQRAMPILPSTAFKVVKDSLENPVIFAIGSDNSFKLLQSTSGSDPEGWSPTNLLVGFDDYTHAVDFDVSQDLEGNVSLGFMLAKKNSSITTVFYASMLPNDLSKTDFSKLSSLSVKIDGINNNFIGRNIRLGSSDDTKRPILLIIGDITGSRIFYQVQANSNTAAKLEFPENLNVNNNGLLGLETGFNFGQRAHYFLYDIGPTRSLTVVTIADESLGSLAYDYSSGNKDLPEAYRHLRYNSIATSTSRGGRDSPSSDLYIGAATGLYRIPNGRAKLMEQVTDKIKDVHQVKVVSLDTNVISLWVAASPANLYYVHGVRQADNPNVKWSTPIQFAQDTLLVAPIRTIKSFDKKQSTNEIFTLDTKLSITHYWQDPLSTMWRHRTARVNKSDYVVNFNSYTTHLRLEDSSKRPVSGKLKITSSEWQYCTVNGAVYSLENDVPAEIATDVLGEVTIISHASDISPAVIHVTSDLFNETLNIYPNGKVHYHLQSITDGPSLKNARTQDNKPVLQDNTSDTVATGVAQSISKIYSSAKDNFAPSKSGRIFTSVEKPVGAGIAASKHSLHTLIAFRGLPNSFAVGMTSQYGSWVGLESYHAQTIMRASSTVDAPGLFQFIGDILHELLNFGSSIVTTIRDGVTRLADGISFVIGKVKEGLEFVLTIGAKVLRFALDTLGKVYRIINYILKLVGVDLDKILAWLGHLMGWDHIWATHKMIAKVGKNFLDYGVTETQPLIESARGLLKTLFKELGEQIKTLELPHDVANRTVSSLRKTMENDRGEMIAKSPAVNFASYHMLHTGPANKDDEPDHENKAVNKDDPMMKLYNDVLKPAYDDVMKKLTETGKDFASLFEHGTIAELKNICADIADMFLSALCTFVDGVLELVGDALKELQTALEQKIDAPIFSALFDFICGLMNEKEDMTVINMISLITALPAVTATKIVTGSTPDQWGVGATDPNLPRILQDTIISLKKHQGSGSGSVSTYDIQAQSPAVTSEKDDEAVLKFVSSDSVQAQSAGGASEKGDNDRLQMPDQIHILSLVQGFTAPTCSILASLSGMNEIWPSEFMDRFVQNSVLRIISNKSRAMKVLLSFPLPADDQHWSTYVSRAVSYIISGSYGILADLIPVEKSELVLGVLVDCICFIVAVHNLANEGADFPTWSTNFAASIGGAIKKGGKLFGNLETTWTGYGIGTITDIGLICKMIYDAQNHKVFTTINIGGAGN